MKKDGISADKDQCRSKYSRIMTEYDAFKRVCDLSGAGWCSETNSPTLDEDGWRTLAQTQPRNTGLYKRFRGEGFAHATMCSLLAGDSRATAEDAEMVTELDASSLLLSFPDHVDDTETFPSAAESAEVHEPTGGDGQEQRGNSLPPFVPPSATQRIGRVKRYRDGRTRAKTLKQTTTQELVLCLSCERLKRIFK
ncbi:hypothetical protein F443_15514 [Phytophthora nicotianae P1569]|uniref:Myb/SANT-like domain-containing protein n=2 Tax=Phytophthora nicotianae TaxID=4792 RepID=V9EHZ2_PHYNI|nr:hypothetical protein F443_15514 [Phytophthora nicotianae P1569]